MPRQTKQVRELRAALDVSRNLREIDAIEVHRLNTEIVILKNSAQRQREQVVTDWVRSVATINDAVAHAIVKLTKSGSENVNWIAGEQPTKQS